MSSAGAERIVRIGAVVVASLAAAGAIVASETLELTFLMLAAVTASLICFDTAMAHRLRSFAPWVLLSVAPIVKTVPTVLAELRSDSGLYVERYDHAGSLLLGACVFGAVALLARPAEQLGASASRFVAAVIAGAALTGALAGASVAFLFDGGFGPGNAGRILETPTWFVLAGIVASAVISASQSHTLSFALTGVLMTSCVTAGVLAFTVAGRDIDAGWFGLLFAGLAVSAAASDGSLGQREQRDRQSNAAVIVVLVIGLIAAASAIAARSDRTAWAPGWALLGVLSLAMFALAMASKPVETQGLAATESNEQRRSSAPGNALVASGAPASSATEADLATLAPESSLEEFAEQLDPLQPRRSAVGESAQTRPEVTARPLDRAGASSASSAPAAAPPPELVRSFADTALAMPGGPRADAYAESPHPVPPSASPVSASEHLPRPGSSAPPADFPNQGTAGSPESRPEQLLQPALSGVPAGLQEPSPAAPPESAREQMPQPAAAATDATIPPPAAVSESQSLLSGADMIASAQAAAAVRTAPQAQRHALAPLAHAHHFDPSTGLLSSAGLQHAIARAFDVPRRAGHVTMLMFMIRDLDRIEHEHGRLASAAVTREVAERVGSLLPQGTGARFARSAYAVVFVGDLSNVTETTQWLARVLLQLRAPVEGGSLGDKIDVVAGMAQCYESEHAAQFVKRANLGLARAVQLPEPTLVAMP